MAQAEFLVATVRSSVNRENPNPTDEVLLVQYRKTRNRSAFECLMARHQAFAYRLAYAVSGHHMIAEDGVQDAFLRVLSCSSGMAERIPCFRAWFYCIVVNATKNILRTNGRRAKREHRESKACLERNENKKFPSMLDEHVQIEVRSRLNKIFATMDDETRVPIVLQYFEGCTQVEIGAMLGISQSQVSRRIATGLEYLRTCLVD